MDIVGQELRLATRRLLRAPAFTVATLLTLALAIGANTAIFAVVRNVVVNPLPYPQSDRLIALHYIFPQAPGHTLVVPRIYSLNIAEAGEREIADCMRAVRLLVLHHVTFSINSLCHYFGRRRFATDDESRNLAWLALPSMGEAWHNNHHAFPTSAEHGMRAWEVDLSALTIRGLEATGLAWDVQRFTRERQERRYGASGQRNG